MHIQESVTVHMPNRKFHVVAYFHDGALCQRIFDDDENGAEDFVQDKADASIVTSVVEIEIY